MAVAGRARVEQRLRHTEIGVVQLRVLAHQRDLHPPLYAADPVHHGPPVGHVRRAGAQPQLAAHHPAQPLLLQQQRHLVQRGRRHVGDDAVLLHVAEQGDLPPHVLRDGAVGAAHQHVRLDAHAQQLLDGVLRGLAFQLPAAGDGHDQRHMDVQHVFPPLFRRHLPDGLQKRLALDVAHRAADLGDDHVGLAVVHGVDPPLDLVGDVWDDLHRAPQIAALPFPVQHGPEHLARGHGGVAVQRLIHEPLVVPQIQIRLRAVVGDEHLPVLVGAHRARIYIKIGVELLVAHPQAALLQQPAQRRGADALAQSGHHAACHENILHPAISRQKICSYPTPPAAGCQCAEMSIFPRISPSICRNTEK